MSDYKLVPYDPAPEMVEAAKDAYMPFGDMDLAIRMAILAAPAVQGEPLGYVVPRMAARLGKGELCGISVLDQPEDGHTLPVYLAPQPAEQQPCPDGIREGAPYDDPAFEAMCREHEIWGTPAAAQCAAFWEAGKRAAEQKANARLIAAAPKLLDAAIMAIEHYDAYFGGSAPDDLPWVPVMREAIKEALKAAYEEELFQVRQGRDTHFGELMRSLEQVDALKAECEKLRKDAERIEWLEEQTKKSRTGISFDWHRHVEDGRVVDHGYRFMRRHFASGFKDSLRKAIDAAMQEAKP